MVVTPGAPYVISFDAYVMEPSMSRVELLT